MMPLEFWLCIRPERLGVSALAKKAQRLRQQQGKPSHAMLDPDAINDDEWQ